MLGFRLLYLSSKLSPTKIPQYTPNQDATIALPASTQKDPNNILPSFLCWLHGFEKPEKHWHTPTSHYLPRHPILRLPYPEYPQPSRWIRLLSNLKGSFKDFSQRTLLHTYKTFIYPSLLAISIDHIQT